jgi:hypothetical protein
MDVNLRNVAFKAFWTAVSAVLGVVLVWLASAPYGWAPVAIVVINAILAWVRERVGQTTPTLAGPP